MKRVKKLSRTEQMEWVKNSGGYTVHPADGMPWVGQTDLVLYSSGEEMEISKDDLINLQKWGYWYDKM